MAVVETRGHGAIFVTGVAGSGKSTVARALALRLGCRFLEGDDFHGAANIAKMASGQALSDEDRWPWLARLGRAADEAVVRDGTVVLSCSALRQAYRDCLRHEIAHGSVFFQLQIDPAEAVRRLQARTGHFMAPGLVDSQFAALEAPGPEEALLVLDGTASAMHLCDAICAWLSGQTVNR